MPTVIQNRQTSRDNELPSKLCELLPPRLILEIEAHIRRIGRIEEIRLRRDRCASLTVGSKNIMLESLVRGDEMDRILAGVSGNSLYAHSETLKNGYITLDGGIRVGIVGRAVLEGESVIGVYDITSISFRLPHRALSVGAPICRLLTAAKNCEGVLIYSPPGVGKTTLLRGVARRMSSGESAVRVCVIDTRGELGFSLEGESLCLDVMTGYPRALGIDIAARTMNAQLMICDEIGESAEADAIISAQNCGVPFVASAHADTLEALLRRTAIKRLHRARVFGWYVGISRSGNNDFNYKITSYEEADEYYQYR